MLSAALDLLACPLCPEPLTRPGGDAGPVRCPAGHSFDVARQGYVNVLTGAGARGLVADTADMVASRDAVQSAGLYSPVAAQLARLASAADLPDGGIVDLGGGTGYYAAAVLDALPGRAGVTLDLSRHAARRAARAHPRLGAVVGNAWDRLPLRDASCALGLCVFAPRNAAELRRVLAPGGLAFVVTPRPGHLAQLAGAAGLLGIDERKEARLAEQFADFQVLRESVVTATLTLDPGSAADIALMGPSAHHRDAGALRAALAAGPAVREVDLDVRVSVFARR